MGAGRAHELLLTARKFDSAEALRIGLLADVVPSDELDARVNAAIDDLALETPGFDTTIELENRQQVLAMSTADQTEAMASYVGRRAPNYRNR